MQKLSLRTWSLSLLLFCLVVSDQVPLGANGRANAATMPLVNLYVFSTNKSTASHRLRHITLTSATHSGVDRVRFDDGAKTIYGISGDFCRKLVHGRNDSVVCGSGKLAFVVATRLPSQGQGIGVSFIRVQQRMPCYESVEVTAHGRTTTKHLHFQTNNDPNHPKRIDYSTPKGEFQQSDYDITGINEADQGTTRPPLIPIINFVARDISNDLSDGKVPECAVVKVPPQYQHQYQHPTRGTKVKITILPLPLSDWNKILSTYASTLGIGGRPAITSHAAYFEIGNEMNLSNDAFSRYAPNYPDIYVQAVTGLYKHLSIAHYRILTGGWSLNFAHAGCGGQGPDPLPLTIMEIEKAQDKFGLGIRIHLGIAVHPYGYVLNNKNAFKNEWPNYESQATTGGPCRDLSVLNDQWTKQPLLHGLPLVYTEINYITDGGADCAKDHQDTCYNEKEGTYLVDLMNYLNTHLPCPDMEHQCTSGVRPDLTPLRVAWWRGADQRPDLLGLYSYTSQAKTAIVTCGSQKAHIGQGGSRSALYNDYYYLQDGACIDFNRIALSLPLRAVTPGAHVRVTGSGFVTSEPISISWSCIKGPCKRGSPPKPLQWTKQTYSSPVVPGGQPGEQRQLSLRKEGNVDGTIIIPPGSRAGTYRVTARGEMSDIAPSQIVIVKASNVRHAHLTLSPRKGMPGTLVTIIGTQFPPRKTLTIYWYRLSGSRSACPSPIGKNAPRPTKNLGAKETDSTGSFSVIKPVPPDSTNGRHCVVAFAPDVPPVSTFTTNGKAQYTGDQVASAPFLVTTSVVTGSTPKGCPSSWICQDIGSAHVTGTQALTTMADGITWTVQGAGGIGNNADVFHYVWQPLKGDGSARARVTGSTRSGQYEAAQAGVMLRASSDPGAPYYYAYFLPTFPGGNIVFVDYRDGQGRTVQHLVTLRPRDVPVYLGVKRVGRTFTAYTSDDGATWTPLNESRVTLTTMGHRVEAGLAVASNSTGFLSTATFDHVSVGNAGFTPRPNTCPDRWTCQDIGAGWPGTQVPPTMADGITWTVQGAGGIGGAADIFHYVWRPLAGDGTARARMIGVTRSGQYESAQAGVMLRASSDPGAPYYFAYFLPTFPGGNIVFVAYRDGQGHTAQNLVLLRPRDVPVYLGVKRIGRSFIAYTSDDGATWVPLNGSRVTLAAMGRTVEAGLAVASNMTGFLSTATFDHVSLGHATFAPVPNTCPARWTCQDIGAGWPGTQALTTTAEGITWTVQGAGGIGHNADILHYAWQPLAGDGTARARMIGVTRSGEYESAQAGVMLRASSDPDAPYYFAYSGGADIVFVDYRDGQGHAVQNLVLLRPRDVPVYLRVNRLGRTFTAYTSNDGATWALLNGSRVTLTAMGHKVEAGLAVASNSTGFLSTAIFDHVSVGS